MKRWKHLVVVGVILCLVLALDSPYMVGAQGVTVSIDAPAQVAENIDFIARININEVTNLDACNYDVTYDPAVLEVTNVTNGVIDGTTIPVDMWQVIAPGTIRVVQNVAGLSGASGSGYLAEIHFHVIGTAGNTSDITYSNGILSDNTANEIPATWVGDSVVVTTTPTPTPTPTRTPTPMPTPTPTPTPMPTPTPTFTWRFYTAGFFPRHLPDAYTGQVVLADLNLATIPDEVQGVWWHDDAALAYRFWVPGVGGELTMLTGQFYDYQVLVTGACGWEIPLQ